MKNADRGSLGGLNLARSALLRTLIPMAAAFACAAFGMVALCAYISAASSLQIVPYVVTVDRTGAVIARDDLRGAQEVPEQALAADLCAFIEKFRGVSSDPVLNERHMRSVYAHLQDNSQAFGEITRYFREERPHRPDSNPISVSIENIIRMTPGTFQIDWNERSADEKTVRLRANVTCKTVALQHSELETLQLNPLGVIVTALTISDISKPAAKKEGA